MTVFPALEDFPTEDAAGRSDPGQCHHGESRPARFRRSIGGSTGVSKPGHPVSRLSMNSMHIVQALVSLNIGGSELVATELSEYHRLAKAIK